MLLVLTLMITRVILMRGHIRFSLLGLIPAHKEIQ